MRKQLLNSLIVVGLVGLGAFGLGCGSASNNDQGTAITMLDFSPTSTSGNSTLIVRLGEIATEPGGTAGDQVLDSSSVYINLGVQNNLAEQGFRCQRLFLDYYIPGAQSQPPSTSVPVSMVLGPGVDNPDITSTLPPAYRNIANSKTVEIPVIPAAIRSWISFNRASLPEPPFQMEVRGYVVGQSTSGDQYQTQQEVTYAEIIQETDVAPTEGSGSSASTIEGSTLTDGTSTDTGSSDTSTGSDGLEGLADAIPTPDSGADGTL